MCERVYGYCFILFIASFMNRRLWIVGGPPPESNNRSAFLKLAARYRGNYAIHGQSELISRPVE